MSKGVCFGFEFRSEVPLSSLRSGIAPRIEVVTGPVEAGVGLPVAEWPEIEGQRAYAAVYKEGGSAYQVTVGRMARFLVDYEEGRIQAHMAEGLPAEVKEGLLLATPAALCISARGAVAVHSGSVDVGGVSVLLAATGSRGKTTLTAGFHNAGYRVLGDDLACCDTEKPAVFPGPALLRLRADSAAALAMVEAEGRPVREGKVHFVVAPERRGDGAPIPVGGIVFLEWGTAGKPRLEPIEPQEAISRLWSLSFFLPSEEDRRRCFLGVVDLVRQTPVWLLRRERNYDQLTEVVSLIADRCAGVIP